MARATKTINPLHFEDLEPHRFEDLVRQLIYDLRQWRSLEAIGRAGGDEGIDIRAIEKTQSNEVEDSEETDETAPEVEAVEPHDRLWIIQCKRERQIGPAKIRKIVSDNLSELADKPYGYILVAACDFSKRAHDTFREEVLNFGVQEFELWGKGEVEDQLFLPKNDHLLFAYFGISLQVRRRSMRTNLRSRLALKRRLVKGLGDINQHLYKAILIRDPRDERYPSIDNLEEFAQSPRWRYWEFYGHTPPDHIAVVFMKCFAYVNLETKEYDYIEAFDAGVPFHPELHGLERNWWDTKDIFQKLHAYWRENVPEANQAWALNIRMIHYDRVLAFDEIGDNLHEGPHILVEYIDGNDPFEPKIFIPLLKPTSPYTPSIQPDEGKRISFFPATIVQNQSGTSLPPPLFPHLHR